MLHRSSYPCGQLGLCLRSSLGDTVGLALQGASRGASQVLRVLPEPLSHGARSAPLRSVVLIVGRELSVLQPGVFAHVAGGLGLCGNGKHQGDVDSVPTESLTPSPYKLSSFNLLLFTGVSVSLNPIPSLLLLTLPRAHNLDYLCH